MNILNRFKNNKRLTANIARDRLLQLIVNPPLILGNKLSKLDIDLLQKELLQVIARHLPMDKHKVRVEVDRDDKCSVLEVNVIIPEEDS